MAEETVVVIPEVKDTEVESEWLSSQFTTLHSMLLAVQDRLTEVCNKQDSIQKTTNQLDARLPADLTGMITSQQATIVGLVNENSQTLRSLLTPPVEPIVVTPEPPPAPVVEEVTPVSSVVSESEKPKRRRI